MSELSDVKDFATFMDIALKMAENWCLMKCFKNVNGYCIV